MYDNGGSKTEKDTVVAASEDEEELQIEVGENSGLASLAVATSVFNFISYSGSFLAIATAPLVSREVAESERKRKREEEEKMEFKYDDDDDDDDENKDNISSNNNNNNDNNNNASKTVLAALALALAVGITATTVVELNVDSLLAISGGESLGVAARESAEEYVKIRALGLPFFCCSLIGIGAFRGVADTRSILNVAIIAESVHFALDWALVLGLHLGVAGAGWSTFASTVLEFTLFSRAMFARGILSREDFPFLSSSSNERNNGGFTESVKDVSGKLGELVSSGSNQLVRTLFLQYVLVRATALATENNVSGPHQIVSQVWWIELFVLDAIAVAAQTLVSTRLAKNDGSEEDVLSAREAVDRCLLWSIALGFLLFVFTEVFVDDLPKIFTSDATVTAATFVPLAFILAPLQPLNALVFCFDGVFQGANDFKFLAKAMIFCSLLAVAALQTPFFADALFSSSSFSSPDVSVGGGHGLEQVWLGVAALMLARAGCLARRYWSDEDSPLYYSSSFSKKKKK